MLYGRSDWETTLEARLEEIYQEEKLRLTDS